MSEMSADLNNDTTEDKDSKKDQRCYLMMKMLINRANARWAESVEWSVPYIYDPGSLVIGRADLRIYKQVMLDLFQEGKVVQEIRYVDRLRL